MKIQKWTTKFKPAEEETSLAPIWINLLNLPWHFYEWAALCRIFSPIGNPIVMDKVTLTKTRPTTAKLRVEIDLSKALIYEVSGEIKNPTGELEILFKELSMKQFPFSALTAKFKAAPIADNSRWKRAQDDKNKKQPNKFQGKLNVKNNMVQSCYNSKNVEKQIQEVEALVEGNKHETSSILNKRMKFKDKITIPPNVSLAEERQQISDGGDIYFSKGNYNSEFPELNIEKLTKSPAERLRMIGI
ncbi:hypothetical protein MTR67_034854 [Solanum verrucosum]|uniref:DUF4283 domain-containing protein n=1 Tax=Solanum verrucosum TaxID=315347 RepID=A0AAF0U940_SOLVR|nr:hypothetical protein MTR67_034854 [Solanum verrucosum]